MNGQSPLGIVVLAAGMGTRMKSDLAKVLHRAAGRTLLDWVLEAVQPLSAGAVVAVVGHQAEEVAATLPQWVRPALQAPQLGTGDAARVGLDGLGMDAGTVLVLPGDMPLLSTAALEDLVAHHRGTGAAATILSARMSDPHGYGRIVRDDDGSVARIVEERDATDEERLISETNTSVYAFDAALLAAALAKLGTDNSQAEYYLTDVIEILTSQRHRVEAVATGELEASGVNSHAHLADVAAVLRRRINERLMADGVWMLDPERVYIDSGVVVEGGARIHPDTYLAGSTRVEAGADVGPGVHATDSTIGAGAKVRFAVLDTVTIGPRADVGPFTYLRPGADLREASKAGAFVEVKQSTIGARSKVPHLSYIGDTTIGEDTNIGAATVTVNYDGFRKHRTIIGNRVRIGSDTMLIAPVEIGDEAYTGAGSVITQDVAPGALAIERSPQKEIPGYAEKHRRRAESSEG